MVEFSNLGHLRIGTRRVQFHFDDVACEIDVNILRYPSAPPGRLGIAGNIPLVLDPAPRRLNGRHRLPLDACKVQPPGQAARDRQDHEHQLPHSETWVPPPGPLAGCFHTTSIQYEVPGVEGLTDGPGLDTPVQDGCLQTLAGRQGLQEVAGFGLE